MGLFRFGKKKKKDNSLQSNKGPAEFELNLKQHIVDNFFKISLPEDWVPYESDRFRAKTENGKTQFSMTNYADQNGEKVIDKELFKQLKLDLYNQFVTEGKYEPYEDLTIKDDFISKSFKVDEETQYYLTTARNVNGRLIISELIIRDIDDYKPEMRAITQIIKDSISTL